MKLNGVLWSCEAPIGNLADNSIGCHDNLLILFDRFEDFPDALSKQNCSYVLMAPASVNGCS